MQNRQTTYKNTEFGPIPEDWGIKDISMLIQKDSGIKIGPFGSQLKKELLVSSGYKVYGQENVYKNNLNLGTRFITTDHYKQLSACEIKSGDFLISMMGTIGKCMIVPHTFQEGIMDSHLIRLRLDKSLLDSNFLENYFKSEILIKQVKRLSVGGIMDGLSSKIVKRISIPLPPSLSEQTAIATALSDTDALISSLEQLIAKKRAIKQGAMQELLRPKAGWEVKKLGEVANFSSGTAHENHVISNGDLIVVNSKFISTEGEVKKYSNHCFCPAKINDILIVLSDVPNGRAIAKCFFVSFNNKYTVNQRIGIIRSDQIDTRFLFSIINRNPYFLSFDDGAKQTNLRNQDVLNFEFSSPKSIAEQKSIATILSDMDEQIASLERKLDKYKQIKQGMMQQLLTGKIRLV